MQQAYPGQPMHAGYPNQPMQQAYPGQPMHAGYPGQPTQQAYPGQPMQARYPGQPMQQAYPGQPMQQAYPGQLMQQGVPDDYVPQGYPGQMPIAPYGAAPVNIVVQNTVGGPGGGLVRVGNRNRTGAALLAFFCGGFGVHKFYLGRTVAGVLYLVFFWTLIPSFMAFVDFIVLLLMNDQDFDLKYNCALVR